MAADLAFEDVAVDFVGLGFSFREEWHLSKMALERRLTNYKEALSLEEPAGANKEIERKRRRGAALQVLAE